MSNTPIEEKYMKKTLALLTFAFFAVSSILVAQEYNDELTGFERAVYYDFVELKGIYYDQNDDYELSEWEKDEIRGKIANKFNITANQAEYIFEKGFNAFLNDWEWEVVDELDDRLGALSDDTPDEEYDRIWYEIDAEYGISVYVLEDLYEKSWEEMFWW